MKRLRGKLTYANVMATVAVFLVLGGGTALAAAQMLPKNSVGSRQLKKGAVSPAKLSKAARLAISGPGPVGPTGPAGPKGDTGAQGTPGTAGTPGADATKLFAQVRGDGTVNVSGSPVTVAHLGSGDYLINFGRDVTHCVAVANEGGVPFFESPASSTPAAEGYGVRIDISSPDPGVEYKPGFPLEDTVSVVTFSGSEPADTSFYLAVLC